MEDKIHNFFMNEMHKSLLIEKKEKKVSEVKKEKFHNDGKCAGIFGFEKMTDKEKNSFYTKLIHSSENLLNEIETKKRENLILEDFLKKEKIYKEKNKKMDPCLLEIEISKFHIKQTNILKKIENLKKEIKYVN